MAYTSDNQPINIPKATPQLLKSFNYKMLQIGVFNKPIYLLRTLSTERTTHTPSS